MRIYDNIKDTTPGHSPKSKKVNQEITLRSSKFKPNPQSEREPTPESPNLKAEKAVKGAFHSLFAETLIKNIRAGKNIS